MRWGDPTPRVRRGVKFQTGAKTGRAHVTDYRKPKPANTPLWQRVSRGEVQQFDCPSCGAWSMRPCRNTDGQARQSNHIDRVRVAVRLLNR